MEIPGTRFYHEQRYMCTTYWRPDIIGLIKIEDDEEGCLIKEIKKIKTLIKLDYYKKN